MENVLLADDIRAGDADFATQIEKVVLNGGQRLADWVGQFFSQQHPEA